jgi:hypothetical protein
MREAVSRRAYWQSALLLAVVIGTLALMWRSAAGDPGPTGLPNDLKYRHNFPGDFRQNAILVLVEAAIAMLLIRPWSYNRSSGRTIIAAFVFLPWLILNLAFMMHSGGIMALHTLWLLALWLSFVVAAAWSGIARPVNRAPRSAGRVP